MRIKHEWSQYVAEFIGTFFLVFFGCGSMILSELGHHAISSFVPVIFGGAVSVMIYAVGHISGAHFNPAVTLAFWCIKRFPAMRILGYIASQVGGATLASVVHLAIWGSDHSFGATSLSIGLGASILVEFILSFVLMFVIISVATDSRATGELAGIAIGSTVALCAFVGGPLTSASMNPARTLGPSFLSGDFSHLWVYVVVPVVGAALGAKTYEWIRCYREEDKGKKHGCC